MNKIALIDVGCGNLLSIMRMFEALDREVTIVDAPDYINKGDTIILPGIGAYDKLIKGLRNQGFYEFLRNMNNLQENKLIGICLGMQVLGDASEEGLECGLGLIPGSVKKIPLGNKVIPNIGWHYVENRNEHYSTKHFTKDERFYFCHSYYFDCPEKNILSVLDYNGVRPAAVKNDNGNIFGFQFHPEKSHLFGFNLLRIL